MWAAAHRGPHSRPPHVHVLSMSLPLKDTRLTESGTRMASFNLNHLLKGMQSHWGLGLQHMNFGEQSSICNTKII